MASETAASGVEQSAPYTILGKWLDWLTAHQRQVLAIGVAFQVLVLAAMMVRPLITLTTGDTVLLRVAPVDPRDLFRGDYVILSYDISQPSVDPTSTVDTWQLNWKRMHQLARKTVYVQLELEPDGKHWSATDMQTEPPAEGRFIRGEVDFQGTINFGIEKYFVQEGKGKDYENAVRSRKLSAEVALGKDGEAQIRRLIVEE